MCGNFSRETWRKPWKLRSTGVAVIKTSRRKSTELRLTVIVRFAVMFYLRSKPVCLINRRVDRPSNLHRVAWKFHEWELKDETCVRWRVFSIRDSISRFPRALIFGQEKSKQTRHVGLVMGDGACPRSNLLHSFRGNLYSNCQIRHTSLSASCRGLDVAAKRWTRVERERRSLTQPFMEMFVLWYRRFCWVSRKGNDFLLIYSRLPLASPYLLGPDYEIGSLASRDNG